MSNVIATQKKMTGTISNKLQISAIVSNPDQITANINIDGTITGTISNNKLSVSASISEANKMTANLNFPEVVINSNIYDGEYIITPSTDTDQVLETKHTYLDGNVTVLKIPTYETSNEVGISFIIGD